MDIRLLELEELEVAMEIYYDVVKDMNSRGLYNWNNEYPSKEAIYKDIKNKSLYGIEENGEIVGVVSIDNTVADEYKGVNWSISGPFYSFHRIAIHPKAVGKGHAKRFISFAEELARENKCKSMRIDSYYKNERALGLYKSLGYRYLGDISLRGTNEPFLCFEKELK